MRRSNARSRNGVEPILGRGNTLARELMRRPRSSLVLGAAVVGAIASAAHVRCSRVAILQIAYLHIMLSEDQCRSEQRSEQSAHR